MRRRFFVPLFAFAAFGAGQVLAQYLGPTPYLSAADSPFASVAFTEYFHLEDFEDGLLDAPGLSASEGFVTSPDTLVDSVDGDDGVIDGNGNGGHSWYSGGDANMLRFSFDETVLGAYPTHAGFVWTDVGIVAGENFGFAEIEFEAFDAAGVSLGVYGPYRLGDGLITGETAEDRFFGIVHADGISAIEARMPDSGDWELDHVQFGRVPEPATMLLLTLMPAMLRRRAAH